MPNTPTTPWLNLIPKTLYGRPFSLRQIAKSQSPRTRFRIYASLSAHMTLRLSYICLTVIRFRAATLRSDSSVCVLLRVLKQ